MRVAFITVGDTRRLTGGYLYHARIFPMLRERGLVIEEVVASEAALAAQLAQAASFGATFEPRLFDVIVVDALARAVCAPWIDGWRTLRPVVAMVHELPSLAEARDDAIALEAPLLRADLLIAVSAHGQTMLEQRGVPGARIRIVSPGRDRLPGSDERRTTKDESSGLQVLCVAQWIPRKAIHTLVEAWAASPRSPAILHLIGETDADSSYAAQVRAAIANAPAHAPIQVHGAVNDAALADAYRFADLFVLPSIYEGYGMVYAEALSYGLPIIACNTGPLPDMIGDAGWLVPPAEPLALAAALDRLLSDRALRSLLAEAARARATSLPTWDDTAREFEHALHEATHL